MKKNKIVLYFNEKEEKVMKVLWNENKPLSATEIALCIDTEWAKKSIQNIIRKLEEKGAIEIAEITKIGKTYGRLFKPAISAEDYIMMQLNRYRTMDSDLSFIISALLNKTDISKDFSKELKDLLSKYTGK